MKKSLIRFLFVLAVLIVLSILIFWSRFSGACAVYRMVGELQDSFIKGRSELDMRITGMWDSKDDSDTLDAMIGYRADEKFAADVHINREHYIVLSDRARTLVQTSRPALLIRGSGSDLKNFDLMALGGEIFRNHHKLKDFLTIGFFKKLGIVAWAFFACDFDKTVIDGQDFRVIGIPERLVRTPVTLWRNMDRVFEMRISAGREEEQLHLRIVKEEVPLRDTFVDSADITRIEVKRRELNAALYRGSLRAVGILLEDFMPPKPSGPDVIHEGGLLKYIEGNRLLLAGGSHRQLGKVHGALLKPEVRKMVDATLYTMGWLYTLERKRWFVDDLRDAYRRLEPFIPIKYQEEMAGLAETSGISPEAIRLTNIFPELFHCSGFALFGSATVESTLYHGRVLDYITELGLQYHAVVFIFKPEGSHAFANIGYAGFIGSVSGMNERQVSFGEMGGRGEGDWDGMPMGFLMREGLERADDLDEAVTIFRDTPRTCEYYYVIADGKIPDARGLATRPNLFDVIRPDQYHPQLPHPFKDAVLMSAGDRYEILAERVRENYGKIDAGKALRLMDRPVAMKSNLHNVLFAPQSLEFWVANAGPISPAADEPYTHYSLPALLKGMDNDYSRRNKDFK